MKCPKCGAEQKPTEVCVECGLVLAKYLAEKALKRERPEPTAEQVKRGKMVSIRRGLKIIRNVNTRDLPEKIQRGELYQSDEISSDEEKWVLAGMHPQLKPLFENPDGAGGEPPEEKEVEVRDPKLARKLARIEKQVSKGKLAQADFDKEKSAILAKAEIDLQQTRATGEKRATLAGGLGVLMLTAGIYLPIYKIRLVPDTSLYDKSLIECGVVAVLTALALFTMAKLDFRFVRTVGLLIGGALFGIFYRQYAVLQQVKKGMLKEVPSGIFEGFDVIGVSNLEHAWGWWVFAAGAFLIFLSGFLRGRRG